MADIRVLYLDYQRIEKQVNAGSFSQKDLPEVLRKLKNMIDHSGELNQRFIALNKGSLHPAEMEQENALRIDKVKLLYARLSKQRTTP